MKIKKLTPTQARWSYYYNRNAPKKKEYRVFDVDEDGECHFSHWDFITSIGFRAT